MTSRVFAFLATVAMAAAVAGCGSEKKTYDIAPIFPASTDKCARYGGDQKGEGFQATCLVSKSECEKAAADWRNSMQKRGIDDATQFSCRD